MFLLRPGSHKKAIDCIYIARDKDNIKFLFTMLDIFDFSVVHFIFQVFSSIFLIDLTIEW